MQIDQAITALQDIVKALHDADGINIALACSTIALAITSIVIGWLDKKRQNNERFERVRPWVVIDGPVPVRVEYENKGSISWEEYLKSVVNWGVPSAVKVGMLFTNTGTRPARKLKRISFRQETIISRQEVENEPEIDMQLDLGPNQSQYYLFDIPWDYWKELINKPIFFALRISYNDGKSISYSGGIYKIVKSQWELITSWYD